MTVGHIPREISWHCYFFLKEERGEINGNAFSTIYRPLSIPSGGLEIPLVLRFQTSKYVTHCKMEKFVQTLYDYRYTGTKANSSDEEPEEEICFSVEEGNMNEKSTEKIGDISSSEDEDFPTSTKKRKRPIEISDDSD